MLDHFEERPVERLHGRAILHAGFSYLRNQRARERRGGQGLVERDFVHLRLDVEANGAVRLRQLKELAEARDACAVERLLLREVGRGGAVRPEAADVVALQHGEGQAVDRRGAAYPATVGSARDVNVQTAVVVDDDHAVFRHADVELEGTDAELEGAGEGGKRILGQVAARAAVALHVDHRIICVCVVTESSLPASSVMRVSQTWLRLPLWMAGASAGPQPALQREMKLVFDASLAVRGPSVRLAAVPAAPMVSANAMSVPPCTTPVVVRSLSLTWRRARTRSGVTSRNSMPRCATRPTFQSMFIARSRPHRRSARCASSLPRAPAPS